LKYGGAIAVVGASGSAKLSRRTEVIRFRVAEDEASAIRERAAVTAGGKVSVYLRRLALGHRLTPQFSARAVASASKVARRVRDMYGHDTQLLSDLRELMTALGGRGS
jgi:hypothetical protein